MSPQDKEALDAELSKYLSPEDIKAGHRAIAIEGHQQRMRWRGQSEVELQVRHGTPNQCRDADMAQAAERLMRQACALVSTAERLGYRLTITRVPVAPLSMGSATGLVEIWRHNNDQFPAIGFAPGLEATS